MPHSAPKFRKPQTKKKDKTLESKYSTFKNLDKAGEIALYYGFTPTEVPEIKKIDLDQAKTLMDGDFVEEECEDGDTVLPLHVEEKVAVLRTYHENDMISLPQPVMLYFKGTFKHAVRKNGKYPRQCNLEILGGAKSISEAILIKTALTILEDEGYSNMAVEINSIGDRDSIAKYNKELTNYYRKHINALPAACRQAMKKNVFALLSCHDPKCKDLNDRAPKSMAYLTEASRTHFKEILEYLEKLGIPYRINDRLIGNHKYCSETVFEIVNLDETKKDHNKTLAIGVRYDSLGKRIGAKRELPGAGISLTYKKLKKTEEPKGTQKVKKPVVYFIQLSFDAKLQSLRVIETLRKAKIPVYQSLGKDKLMGQVAHAEKLEIPCVVLMGKKEALEDTVIVRDMSTRSQETVKIDDLAGYLKKLKLA